MQEFKKVWYTEKDMAGKRRVWVDIGGESLMLKFDKDVSQQEIKDEVNKVLKAREETKLNEIEEIDRQITELQLRKSLLENGDTI